MKYKAALEELHSSIKSLDQPTTLALLNIDEALLDLPDTTLSYIARWNHWKRLRHVVASIPHLIHQGSTAYTPLVGFLGHFSSGKSTLINAIMEIDQNEYPAYRRDSGRNPTDKGITLTTHLNNYPSTSKEFLSFIDKVDVVQGPRLPAMEHMTLVDTPGLGDDAAEMDRIIRFLHLVHVLVLTVDGRRPFADTDKDFALLDVAFNRLVGVPKIFAITSAVDFLSDRRGEFDTEWNQAEADAFWRETLDRLFSDPRFADRKGELAGTPHHFVDSIEAFRISNLVDTILPIVLDDEQRTRTDIARAEYVIRSAVESLEYLEEYVGERSQHLGKLRLDAEQRSENTKTAIENLIVDLDRRLASILEFLQGQQNGNSDISVPLDQIVTIDTLSQDINMPAMGSAIRDALQDLIDSRRSQMLRRSREYYRRRSNGTMEQYNSELLVDRDIAATVKGTGLLGQLRLCGRTALSTALVRHQATRTIGLELLERRSERGRVMSAAREIQSEFDRFQEVHDDTVKALIAYITQPSSLELLREHGFIVFDRSGHRIANPDSIDISNREDYRRLVAEIEKCKDALKDIYDQATVELETNLLDDLPVDDDDADEELPFESMGPSALEPIVEQISARTSVGVRELDQTINEQVAELTGEIAETKQATTARIREIWQARGRVAARLALVMLFFSAVGLILGTLAPDLWTRMWSSLPEWMIQGAISSTITSLILSICVFIFIGFTNANLRVAFGSTTFVRLRRALLRRRHQQEIRRITEEGLGKAKVRVSESLDAIDDVLLRSVVHWLEHDCATYGKSAGELRQLGQRVSERRRHVNELVSKIATFQQDLGAQLRERSEAIRSAAVSTHMLTIRKAAEDVEQLRKTVAEIKEKARRASVI